MDDHPPGQGPKLIVIDDFMDEIKNHTKELLKFLSKVHITETYPFSF